MTDCIVSQCKNQHSTRNSTSDKPSIANLKPTITSQQPTRNLSPSSEKHAREIRKSTQRDQCAAAINAKNPAMQTMKDARWDIVLPFALVSPLSLDRSLKAHNQDREMQGLPRSLLANVGG